MNRSLYLIPFLVLIQSCKPDKDQVGAAPAEAVHRDILFEILDAEQSGIHFQNKLVESTSVNGIVDNYYYNGAGVATGDFNKDGLQDI